MYFYHEKVLNGYKAVQVTVCKCFITSVIVGELPTAQPTLFEYFWDLEQKKWIPWAKLVPKYVHSPEKKYNEILVPTVDTVRTTWILNLMVSIKRPVVLIGETGTSKTATIADFLRTVDQESHVRSIQSSHSDVFSKAFEI